MSDNAYPWAYALRSFLKYDWNKSEKEKLVFTVESQPKNRQSGQIIPAQ